MKRLLLWIIVAPVALWASPDFEREIRPILKEHCVECHGAKKQKGELRLDARKFAFKGGHDGAAFVAGNGAKSALVQRVTSEDVDERMPPKGERLSSAKVTLLRAWVDAGAVWKETDEDRAATVDPRLRHWSVQPVRRPPVPRNGAANPIDAFILAKLNEEHLAPSPEADRRTLIRRLSFDLLGLPPTPERVQQFVIDPDPRAYEALVDEFLASPHYGERWARHWLDIAHYADTQGFERDQLRPHAWRYRDYVIEALNADKPYDAFVREQIAGDVLAPNDSASVIATGFLAAGPWDYVGHVETKSPALNRAARAGDLDDMVTQVVTATMGITINCARCHDHKLDPITQEEYYRLWSVFAGVKRADRALTQNQEAKHVERERLKNEIKRAADELKKLPEKEAERSQSLTEEKQRLEATLREVPEVPLVFGIASEGRPAVVRVQRRGNAEDPQQEVEPGAFGWARHASIDLADNDAPEGQRRLALARWITDPANPLTRRVLVNRLWHHHFGQGLVSTPSDFGLGGDRPSHPELLDWLAEEFLARGWSLKAMHRLICTSATYRQASPLAPGSEAAKLDAGNRLLWRQNPRRLDAESLRDAVLSVAGTLNPAMGGPGFRDFKYTEAYAPIYEYVTADKPELWRRTIYRFAVRTTPQQFLTTLDCPDPANITPARANTTTALQALTLSNNEFMLQQAQRLAERVEKEATPEARVERAFLLTLQRAPRMAELDGAAALVREQGLFALCRALLNTNEFLYLD